MLLRQKTNNMESLCSMQCLYDNYAFTKIQPEYIVLFSKSKFKILNIAHGEFLFW